MPFLLTTLSSHLLESHGSCHSRMQGGQGYTGSTMSQTQQITPKHAHQRETREEQWKATTEVMPKFKRMVIIVSLSTPKAEANQTQPWSGQRGVSHSQSVGCWWHTGSHGSRPCTCSCVSRAGIVSLSFVPVVSTCLSKVRVRPFSHCWVFMSLTTSCRKANRVWATLTCCSFCCTLEQLSGTWSC